MALGVREDSRITFDLGFHLNNSTISQTGEYRRRSKEKDDDFMSATISLRHLYTSKGRYPASLVNMWMWNQEWSGLKSEIGYQNQK